MVERKSFLVLFYQSIPRHLALACTTMRTTTLAATGYPLKAYDTQAALDTAQSHTAPLTVCLEAKTVLPAGTSRGQNHNGAFGALRRVDAHNGDLGMTQLTKEIAQDSALFLIIGQHKNVFWGQGRDSLMQRGDQVTYVAL